MISNFNRALKKDQTYAQPTPHQITLMFSKFKSVPPVKNQASKEFINPLYYTNDFDLRNNSGAAV